jgi:hypothetical protein
MAAAIERVAERVGPVQAIVAHSMGAAAATLALSRGLPVERVVYIAPPENPGGYLDQAARFLGFGAKIAVRAQNRIEGRFSFLFGDARGTLLAPGLDVPLLVIHDLNDPEVPHAEAVRLVEAWPGAELMTTEGLGHVRILRAQPVQDAAIGFLCGPIRSSRAGSMVDGSSRPAVHLLKPSTIPEGRRTQGGILLGTWSAISKNKEHTMVSRLENLLVRMLELITPEFEVLFGDLDDREVQADLEKGRD